MAKYIVKRLLQSLLTVFIVIFVVFLLLRLMPTDGYFTRDDYVNMSEAERQMYLIDISDNGIFQALYRYRVLRLKDW